jgi:hypothetical protein
MFWVCDAFMPVLIGCGVCIKRLARACDPMPDR